MKKITAVLMVMVLTAALWGCAAPSGESEVTVLAAASLTDVCGELKTVYEEENEGITINFSFGGSGALQTQIEEGAPADMFISAADTQMNALLAQGLIEEDSVTGLLENKAACDALKSGLTATEIGGAAITYAELASFWASLENHEMTTLIATPAAIAEIAAMEQMKCCTGINAEGRPVTPFGLELVKCTNLGENIAIGIDKTAALEMVYGTDVVVDFDKLISTQCEEIAASIMVGFSKLTEGAVKTIKTA